MQKAFHFLILSVALSSTQASAINPLVAFRDMCLRAGESLGLRAPSSQEVRQRLEASGISQSETDGFMSEVLKIYPEHLGGLSRKMASDTANSYIKLKSWGYSPAECRDASFYDADMYHQIRKRFGTNHKETMSVVNEQPELYIRIRSAGDVTHAQAVEIKEEPEDYIERYIQAKKQGLNHEQARKRMPPR